MNRHATDAQEPVQEWVPARPLPADHVLSSGAVLFPGAFDQHGCPLILFPVDGQARIASELSKAEVVDFINYFLGLHNKKQEKHSLVSVVADLRQASLPTVRFIAETLVLLELHKRTVHAAYIVQPKKKDAAKLLSKLLAPSKSYNTSFKKVLLKEIPELSNYVDRSQLPASLGGYLVYSHQSWVAFVKDIDVFMQEFLSVVQRLPPCISTLQALSRLQPPSTHRELRRFCAANEAKFRQLRRELGLDELLRHCESVLEKLRYPESEPCYEAMAGTALFTHTAFDMLHNHSRIMAAVEKVDLLWQQAFSKARLQLQVFHLRDEALQITEKIETLLQEKLQPYKMDIAKDTETAGRLASEFEGSIHAPAMALARCAEDLIHALEEVLPSDGQGRESWAVDLKRLKDKLHSSVHFILQTLRAVVNYHHYYDKAIKWYGLVLHENFLQELLSGVRGDEGRQQAKSWGTVPAWRRKLLSFLKKNPSPEMEELVHLTHLSNVIPDDELQGAGKEISHRCMTLRKLLISSGPVAVGNLQMALQWQYDLLRSSYVDQTAANDSAQYGTLPDARPSSPETSPVTYGITLVDGKPPSLSSFDSGFDGAASGGRKGAGGPSRLRGSTDPVKAAPTQPQIHQENPSSVPREFDSRSLGGSSRAGVQVPPPAAADSLNFEIKVKRSAALPSNPWLSLPVDDLESSYTVTITPNPVQRKGDRHFSDSSNPRTTSTGSNRSEDRPLPIDVGTEDRRSLTKDWILHSQGELEDSELSSIANILSSTVTEGKDGTVCTTDGMPTLLWDSYDLHNQNLDTVDGGDVSLSDWDVREQEGLQQVEEMLVRADEILEEEENVLAQEAALDALLGSEDSHRAWSQWSSEDRDREMSTTELAEAGVLGLDDSLDPSGSDGELESSRVAEGSAGDQFHVDTAGSGRLDLLRKLQEVHFLDELIEEENKKIHELRAGDQTLAAELQEPQPLVPTGPPSGSKEREDVWIRLEKEKLEENLSDVKNDKKAPAVIRCSVMEKLRTEDKKGKVLLENLLAASSGRSLSTRSVGSDDEARDTSQTESLEALSKPRVAEETMTQHVDDLSESGNQSDDAEPTRWTGSTSGGSSDGQELSGKGVQLQRWHSREELDQSWHTSEPEPFGDLSDLDALGEASLQDSEQASLPPHHGDDGPDQSANAWTPEASLTLQTKPDGGVFGPGVAPLLPPPVPEPREAPPPANVGLARPDVPHSAGAAVSDQPWAAENPSFIDPDLQASETDSLPENVTPDGNLNFTSSGSMKQQSNNNNHSLPINYDIPVSRLSDASNPDEDDVSMVTPHSPPCQSFVPKLPPDQHVEFDPGGYEPGGDNCSIQSTGSMRTSDSGSAGVQYQPPGSTREMADFETPIVLDTGSGLMKAGFANQDLPSVIFPTIIGTPKYEEIMNGAPERETFIGHDAQQMRGVLALRHPIKNGVIRNWDDMEKIWHHTFQQLRVEPEDHPVLLTEAAMNPLENRQRMVEIMFERFAVPFTYVAVQAVLALYADGRTTGVVFDSGDGVSHSVPVFEGYSLPHAVQRFPLAGMDVTMHLKKLLQEQGVSMRTTAEEEIVRDMKEKCCRVALDYEAELSRGGSSRGEVHYTMPDGQIVTLASERFRAPEILFKPELIGRDHCGMHESIFRSVQGSDIDLRRSFLGNIVLSGGNTLLAGLPERLQAEIRGLLPADAGESVRVSSPKDRDFSVWSGGAVMAGLPGFSSAWISQEEYEEHGPQIVFRKCF